MIWRFSSLDIFGVQENKILVYFHLIVSYHTLYCVTVAFLFALLWHFLKPYLALFVKDFWQHLKFFIFQRSMKAADSDTPFLARPLLKIRPLIEPKPRHQPEAALASMRRVLQGRNHQFSVTFPNGWCDRKLCKTTFDNLSISNNFYLALFPEISLLHTQKCLQKNWLTHPLYCLVPRASADRALHFSSLLYWSSYGLSMRDADSQVNAILSRRLPWLFFQTTSPEPGQGFALKSNWTH